MARTISATERAYHETKTAILDGTIAGGCLLTEGQVSANLGVSRTPVREAFLRLQAEGLLELYPKRGAVVSTVRPDEVLPVLEAREIVESHAVTKLLTEHEHCPDEVVDTLSALLTQMDSALRAQDHRAFVHADGLFHLELVATCENPFLIQLARQVQERQSRLKASPGNLATAMAAHAKSYAEHVTLVGRIEAGDLDGALAALRTHLRGSRLRAVRAAG